MKLAIAIDALRRIDPLKLAERLGQRQRVTAFWKTADGCSITLPSRCIELVDLILIDSAIEAGA